MNMLLLWALLAANPQPASPLDDQAFAIGKELRCPVCQGMAIAESPSTMARDMMTRVRGMLAEGKSRDEILSYYTERYGEWVLLEPPARGFGLWVWGLPPLLLVVALIVAVRTMRRLRQSPAPVGGPPVSQSATSDDPYVQAIRDEVHR